MVEHEIVAESAVVARPHNVKGECLHCFVTLTEGSEFTDKLVSELKVKGKVHCFTIFLEILIS